MENHNDRQEKSDSYYISIIAIVHLIVSILLVFYSVMLAVIHSEEKWPIIVINILLPWLRSGGIPDFLLFIVFPVWSIIYAIAIYYIAKFLYRFSLSIFRKASGKLSK